MKNGPKRISSPIHSPHRFRHVTLLETFSSSYRSKSKGWTNPGVPMNDGQSGSIRPSTSYLLSPRQLEPLAWYDMRSSEIYTLIFIWQAFSPSTVIFAGIGVLLSVRILDNFVCDTVTHTIVRRRRMSGQAKTRLWTSLNALKCSSDVL